MKGVFQFKQFSVDQTGCAMKINTDGVLLGALPVAYEPKNILDIGTGTGVIALLLVLCFFFVFFVFFGFFWCVVFQAEQNRERQNQ